MNPRYVTGIIFLFVWGAALQARAQEAVSPSLAYPHFQVTTRNNDDIRRERIIRVPKADRPENNVTDMPPKAREQFERNEAHMRKKLDENADRWDRDSQWRKDHLRRDHDDDHGRDRRDRDRDHDRWQSTTAMQNGPFVPQTIRSEKKRRGDGHRHHRRHHRHYRYNYYSRLYVYEPVTTVRYDDDYDSREIVPQGYDDISYGGVTYYYKDGQFYVPTNGDIVEVQPPLGAVVPKLPDDPVIIESNGTYYVYNGIYYRKTWGGYEVIVPPFNPREYQNAPMSSRVSADIYVRLPDDDGNYTEVKLSRTTRGFKGPQGEYYSEFPPMEELQEMYGDQG